MRWMVSSSELQMHSPSDGFTQAGTCNDGQQDNDDDGTGYKYDGRPCDVNDALEVIS